MQRNPLKEIYGGRLSLEHIRSNYTCLLIRGCFFKQLRLNIYQNKRGIEEDRMASCPDPLILQPDSSVCKGALYECQ
ncbi:hypothetical protein CapIbe_014546 [Capra ibex]